MTNNTLSEDEVRRIFEQFGFSAERAQDTLENMAKQGNDYAKVMAEFAKGFTKAQREQENFQKSMRQSSSVLNGFSNSLNRVSRENDSLSADLIKLRNQVENTTDSNEKARLMQEKAAKESANMYIEAGKLFSDGVQIMAGGALKTLSNALTSASRNILTSHSGLSSANQILQSGIDVVNSAAQGGASALKSFGAATAGAGGSIGKMGLVASLAGGALSSFSHTLTDVAKSGMSLLYNQTTHLMSGFASMASAGALFTGDLKTIADTVSKSGLTVEQFAKVTSASKDSLIKTGLGITDGSKKLIASMNAGGATVRNGLSALGFSMEEQADLYAQTMANMAGPRGKLVASDDEVAKQTSEYARNLRLISDLTGKNIKDLQAEGASRTSDAAMQIEFMKMGAEQAAKAEQAFGALTATEAKGLKSAIIHGQNIDQDSAILEQQMPALKAKMAELRALYDKGELDATAVSRINAKYKDQIQADVERQKHLATATTNSSGTLNAALADIASGTRKSLGPAALAKREQELIDAQKAGEKGLTTDGKKNDFVALSTKEQKHKLALQELATTHLDKYTDILDNVLSGMTTAVKEFTKVFSGQKSPTDVLKSIGEGILANLGTIATVFVGMGGLGGIKTIFNAIAGKKLGKEEEVTKHARTMPTVPSHEPTIPGSIHQPEHSGGKSGKKGGKRSGKGARGATLDSPAAASPMAAGSTGIISEIGEVAGKVGPEILGGGLAGIATGLKAFAAPQVLLGATILSGSVAILAAGVAGSAWMLGKMLPTLAEGIKSFGEIEGGNLVDVGKGLGLLALGLGAFAATSVLTAVSGVFNKISDFLGVGVSSVIDSMKKFSDSEIKADVVKTNAEAFVAFSNAMAQYSGTNSPGIFASLSKWAGEFFSGGPPLAQMIDFQTYNFDKSKIINNAEAFTAFSNAMASYKGTASPGVLTSLANAASNFLAGGAPLTQMVEFQTYSFDKKAIVNNAEAFTAFSNALASYKGASGVDFSTALVMSTSFFSKGLPLQQLQEFAKIELQADTITKNASAFVAFSNALAQYKGASGVDFTTALVMSRDFFKENPPLEQLKDFAKIELKADVITRNATAFVEFSKALEQYKGSGSPGVFSSLSKWVGEFFAGGPPLAKLAEFSAYKFDKATITNNAEAFTAFSNALASYKGTNAPGLFSSLSTSIGEFFSGGAPLTQMAAFGAQTFDTKSIKNNAEAFTAFSNAIASYKGASGVDIGTALVMSTDFFNKGLPFKQLQDFAKIQLDADVITRNANAFIAFSNALASYKGASGVDFSTAMVMSKDFFEKDPPLNQLIKFAKIQLEADIITRNANAFISFSNALAQYKGASGVDLTTALVMSRNFFKDNSPLKQLETFSAMTINPAKVEENATAFVKFSNALAAFTGFGGGDGIITGAMNKLKSLIDLDPFSYMQKFANMKFDNTDQLKTNTELFQKFATALSTYAGAGSKFSEMKVLLDEDAKAVSKLDERMKSLIDRFKGMYDQLSKLGANFNVIFTKDGEAKISAGTGTTGGTVTAPSVTTTPPAKPEVPTPKPEPKPATAGANAVAGGVVSKPSESASDIKMVGVKGLLERIAHGEGTSDVIAKSKGYKSGYDVSFGFGAYGGQTTKTLSEMTLAEVKEYQKKMLSDPKNTAHSSAVGKYQFISGTLAEFQKKLGLSDDTKFDAETQDKLAMRLLQDVGIDKFRSGKMSADTFQKRIAGRWASVADPTTKVSAYGQHLGTTDAQIKEAIARLDLSDNVVASKNQVDAANQVAANIKTANDIDKQTIQDKKSVAEQIKQATTFVGADEVTITGMQAEILNNLKNGRKITDSQVTALASLNDNEELVNDSKTRSVDLAKNSTNAEKEKNAAAEETALLARKYPKITSGLIEATENTNKAFAKMGVGIDPSKLTPNLQKQVDDTNKAFAALGNQINPSKITSDIKQTVTATGDVFNNMSKRIDTSDLILASVKKVESANNTLAKVSDPTKLTTTMTDNVTRGFTNLFDPANNFGLPKLTPKPTDNVLLAKTTEKESFALMDKERKARTDSVNSIIAATEPLTGFKFSNANLNQPLSAYATPKDQFNSVTPKVNATTTAIADDKIKKQAEEEKRLAEEKSKPDPMLMCLNKILSAQEAVANNTGAQVGIASEANDYNSDLVRLTKMNAYA